MAEDSFKALWLSAALRSSISDNLSLDANGRDPDLTLSLSRSLMKRIFHELSLRQRVRLETVSKHWRSLLQETYAEDPGDAWVYLIFRKNHVSGHHNLVTRTGYFGPVFWRRQVVYAYACCCHFAQRHDLCLRSLLSKLGGRVDRISIVDSPLNFRFLTDDFFRFTFSTLTNLKWVYVREIDLEAITVSTLNVLLCMKQLKRFVIHYCRNYDTLKDFDALPQLLICNSPIKGLLCFEEVEKHLHQTYNDPLDMNEFETKLRELDEFWTQVSISSNRRHSSTETDSERTSLSRSD